MSQVEAVFPARFAEIARICALVQLEAAAAGFDEKEQFRLQLACDEACTNIIEHAYGGENRGHIRVLIRQQDGSFLIQLHDTGRPFDPSNLKSEPSRPPSANLTEIQEGGWGLHFMHSIMDEVHFDFDVDQGNTLTMIKEYP